MCTQGPITKKKSFEVSLSVTYVICMRNTESFIPRLCNMILSVTLRERFRCLYISLRPKINNPWWVGWITHVTVRVDNYFNWVFFNTYYSLSTTVSTLSRSRSFSFKLRT